MVYTELMGEAFDPNEAKQFLRAREARERNQREEVRKTVLTRVVACLQKRFQNTTVEVYLVGSVIRPFAFTAHSDIDIVLKNYQGDRFALWAELEKEIEQVVEVILFEGCHFQEFVVKEGLKVV